MKNLLGWVAIVGIKAYRKWLSPIKGFKCAHGMATGKGTCSGLGLRYFQKTGPLKALMLLARQFDRCALAARSLRGEESKLGVDRRLGPRGMSQSGFVDCGGCDAPGCDAPGCDLPACDAPSCEVFPGQAWECLRIGDSLGSCGCSGPSSCDGCFDGWLSDREERANKAKSRQAKREEARRARRRQPSGNGEGEFPPPEQ